MSGIPLASQAPVASTYGSAAALPASGGTPGRAVGVACTTAGTIALALASGTVTIPITVGWTVLPFAATGYTLGGGAAATVYNLN